VALYRDEEIIAANPFMRELYDTVTTAVARPTAATGPRYNQVSHAFRNAVHEVLSGREQADGALARLDRRLQRLRRGGRWF
jgi:trehalose/maltose transport system substrate-binding protein